MHPSIQIGRNLLWFNACGGRQLNITFVVHVLLVGESLVKPGLELEFYFGPMNSVYDLAFIEFFTSKVCYPFAFLYEADGRSIGETAGDFDNVVHVVAITAGRGGDE